MVYGVNYSIIFTFCRGADDGVVGHLLSGLAIPVQKLLLYRFITLYFRQFPSTPCLLI